MMESGISQLGGQVEDADPKPKDLTGLENLSLREAAEERAEQARADKELEQNPPASKTNTPPSHETTRSGGPWDAAQSTPAASANLLSTQSAPVGLASNGEAAYPPLPPTPVTSPPGDFKYDGNKPWYFFGKSSTRSAGEGPTWVPDSAVTQCQDCKVTFAFFTRKHHCRYCGRIFCHDCSSQFLLLPQRFGVREPQRVCRPCATQLEPLQEELVKTISNQTRELDFDPKGGLFSSPLSFSMTAEITKAAHAVENFFGNCPNAMIQDQYIPITLLKQAKGLAFLTVLKAGFLFSGRFGTGLVVAKTASGAWSAPSAIATVGLGWGAQIGGEVSDFVIILNTPQAVDAFSGAGQLSLGAELAVAVGPLGRSGEASLNLGDGGVAPCYTYSQSKGFFAGVSLEGAVISARNDVNKRFYGTNHSRAELLSGQIAQPNAAKPLYVAIQTALTRSPTPDSRGSRAPAGSEATPSSTSVSNSHQGPGLGEHDI